jgi:hypothetical protein
MVADDHSRRHQIFIIFNFLYQLSPFILLIKFKVIDKIKYIIKLLYLINHIIFIF